MDCKRCTLWNKEAKRCTDVHEWINQDGEDCCRYQDGAIMLTGSTIETLQAENKRLREERDEAVEMLEEILEASKESKRTGSTTVVFVAIEKAHNRIQKPLKPTYGASKEEIKENLKRYDGHNYL
jgi:hypothetical protein